MAGITLRTRLTSSCTRAFVAPLLVALGCGGHAPPPQAPTPAATAEPAAPPPPALPQPAQPPDPAGAITSSTPAALVIKEGLATPESVFYDVESDVYLASNINGSPLAVDDNGFISRISPDGQILELKWIDGAKDNIQLNAPKGITALAGVLYVADIDHIRKFDLKTGEPKGDIAVKGATFLNDIGAGPDGTLYFTDSGMKAGASGFDPSGTDAVYKLVKDQPKAVIRGKNLNGPNGLFADASGVWVVSFRSNELYNVKSGKKTDVRQLPKGGLDGIVKTNDGRLLVTSWEANQIFGSAPGEEFIVAVPEVKSPADIGYDVKRNRLLIPLFMDNTILIQPL